MRTLVTAATFELRRQAEDAQLRLRKAGMESEIEDDSTAQKSWYMLEPHAAGQLLMERELIEKARPILATMPGRIHCPECGASQVEYPQITRKFPMPLWVFAILAKIGFIEPQYYCECCHCTWPVKAHSSEPSSDLLGWPTHNDRTKT